MIKQISIVLCLLINTIAYSQLKEGQTFCTATKDGSYFPLTKNEKIIYWSDTYYIETKSGIKNINGKLYQEFKQTWEGDNISTFYLREENGVVYQYEECCEEETIRYDKNFKKGHTWKTAEGMSEYTIISYEGKLNTPFCKYDNLLVVEAKITNGIFNFYYSKGHGYIGATKEGKILSCAAPSLSLEKAGNTDTAITTDYGIIKVPGKWEVFNYTKDSNQYYLKNSENITIAVAINPKKNYSFYSPKDKDNQTTTAYFKWEYDYRVKHGFKTSKIKQDKKKNFIIWKFNENNIDNVFLYGVKSDYLLNFLVYTDQWEEKEKIAFLENLYELNSK